jgi:hypothetical protein
MVRLVQKLFARLIYDRGIIVHTFLEKVHCHELAILYEFILRQQYPSQYNTKLKLIKVI